MSMFRSVFAFVTSLALPLAAQQADALGALQLGEQITWRSDGTELRDRGNNRALQAMVDRPALIDAACATAKAEGKLVLWYVHRIVEKGLRGNQLYRAPVLDVYTRQVLFTDPDVAALVGECFVPVRCVCDQALSDRFGLKPLQFVEPAVVFLDGDGRIVHHVERIRTFAADWFLHLCCRVLDHARIERKGGDPAQLRRQGRFEAALAALAAAPDKQPADWLAIAGLHRLLRQPDQALAALDNAGTGKEVAGDAACERGLVLTLQGRRLDAQPLLERAWRSRSARSAEAGYLHAMNSLAMGDEMGAMRRFQLIAQQHADTPYGRKAAANTLLGPDDRPVGAAFTGFETTTWLPEAAYRGLPRDTTWQGDALTPAAMTRQALVYLLGQQRDDGGFTDSRYAYWPDSEITPNVWVAITAIACTALVEQRAGHPDLQDRIDRALARGETFMFDDKRLNRGKNEDCYSDTYRLMYLARRAEQADPALRAQLLERMNQVVAAAAAGQKPSGFWSHEYENAFATAAVLQGLLLARGAGADVPAEVTDKGAGALLSARAQNGGFVYGGALGRGKVDVKDSSGRMPVCEASLLALGRSDLDKLRAAMDVFWQHIDRLETVRRNDFHSDGELAGFFFFHSVYHASEAVAMLPETERPAHHQRFVALLQRIPEMDGSFLDSHEIGRSYGTAMALLTLRNVAGRP